MSRRLLLIPATAALLNLTACMSDVQDAKYSSQIEAAKAGAFDQGWVPRWVPEGAINLRETHNLDTNESLLAFSLPAQPAWQPPAFCQPADAAQLPASAFERKWAPTSFDGYQTYACQPPEAGPGLAHALAIAPDGRSVLVWSSSR